MDKADEAFCESWKTRLDTSFRDSDHPFSSVGFTGRAQIYTTVKNVRGGFVNINWTNSLWSISLFVIYVITSCFGLYLIKAAEGWKTPAFAIGFVLYGAGAVIWMVILRLMPLSFAFPIAAGLLMIGTMLTGAFFLSETVTAWHIAGAFMIITGIVLIAANR